MLKGAGIAKTKDNVKNEFDVHPVITKISIKKGGFSGG